MAVTTGKDTGTTSKSDGSSASPGSGGQRGAGSNYGSGSGRPGTTSSTPSSTPSSSQKSAPGKTDKEAPAPTSAPGKTDKVGTSEATKTPGLAGIQTQRQQAAFDKQKDLYSQAGGASSSMRQATKPTESAKVTDPSRGPNRGLASTSPQTTKTAGGKTDQQKPQSVNTALKGDIEKPQTVAAGKTSLPSSTLAKPTPVSRGLKPNSFIDSLVNAGPTPPGALTVGGSLLGKTPTAPNMSQSVAMDPISYQGPRVGTTPATPAGHPNMGIDDAVSQMADAVKRAQQGTLLSNYASPAPKAIADRVAPTNPTVAQPAPAMTDPRLSQLQEQFNRIAQSRNPVAQSMPSPSVQPAAPAPPMGQVTNPMYRDPAAQANAVRAAVALGMGAAPPQQQPNFHNISQPTNINVPGGGLPTGAPGIAPSQQGALGVQGGLGVQGYAGDVTNPPLNVPSGSSTGMRDDFYGGSPTSASPTPSVSSGADAISPSQGDYPADENFMQDDGQPQSLGELRNRYDYEKGLAKQGLADLPGKLFHAITTGDIRGFTPETNDKRVYTQPQRKTQAPRQQPQGDAAVARLIALIKAMEQQGGDPSQADLVNSTFI